MKTCVVVPTYNERENVIALLEGLKREGVDGLEVVVVDDSSPDGTGEAVRSVSARDPSVHLLSRASKKGIGSAYVDGFSWALRNLDPDVIVEMDADLQHPPAMVGRLVHAVAQGADLAIASRYVEGGGTASWGRWRRTVSSTANGMARLMLGLSVKDCTSGFRAYSKGAAAEVASAGMPAKGFEFQVATLHLLKRARVVEVPYTFGARMAGRSKLGLVDMMRFFFSLVVMSLSR